MIEIIDANEKMKFDIKLSAWDRTEGKIHIEARDEDFLRKKECLVRLYVVDCVGLNEKSDDTQANSYLKIKLGNYLLDVYLNFLFEYESITSIK